MRKSKRSNKKIKARQNTLRRAAATKPVASQAAKRITKGAKPSFSILAYFLVIIGGITVALSALDGLKSAVELMPPIGTLAKYWLRALEFIWRPISELFGFPYFAETGTMMSCFIALMLICAGAMILETRHSSTALLPERNWTERVGTMLIAGSVATLTFVFLVELVVLKNNSVLVATSLHWWQWGMHAIALVSVPLVLMQFGWRHFLEVVVVGVLCGVLFCIISLPSALMALQGGERAVSFFRSLLLEYSLVMLPWRIALLMAMATPRFLLAQLGAVGGVVGLIVWISWLATLKNSA